VECGTLRNIIVKLPQSQAGFLLNIIFKSSSVKDGLAVVEQGENAGKPRPPVLHLHIVMGAFFILILLLKYHSYLVQS
jgi:hypothetical protein